MILRELLALLGIAVYFWFELEIIINRIIDVLEIEEKEMICLQNES